MLEQQLKNQNAELQKQLDLQTKAVRTLRAQFDAYKIDVQKAVADNKNAVKIQEYENTLNEIRKKTARIEYITAEIETLSKERTALLKDVAKL